MKNRTFKHIADTLVKNNIIWAIFGPLVRIFTRIDVAKKRLTNPKTDFTNLLGQPCVKSGPFQGLAYPSYDSVGSSLYPKILGSYEMELHPVVYKIIESNYKQILDLGCAEGYYAVGFALKMQKVKVHAYDINPEAIKLCKKMAEHNSISDRIFYYDECTEKTLLNFDFNERTLIISDCEGYEKFLFTNRSLNNLSSVDVLVEVHDFIDLTISSNLLNVFKDTHSVTKYQSIDDIFKAREYDFVLLRDLDLNKKREILSEGRPSIMEWYFFQSHCN
jgi:hypothetical protein